MTSIDTARALLPKMPDDVFNIYIVPLIEAHGWPFLTLDQPTSPGAEHWEQMFDHQPLGIISLLSWKKFQFRFSLAAFHPRSRGVIAAIIDHHMRGIYIDGIARVHNSHQRFFWQRKYLLDTGELPEPVILQYDLLGLRVLDGNHRLAALASFDNAEGRVIEGWVGVVAP